MNSMDTSTNMTYFILIVFVLEQILKLRIVSLIMCVYIHMQLYQGGVCEDILPILE